MENKNTVWFTRKKLTIAAIVVIFFVVAGLIVTLFVLAVGSGSNSAPPAEEPVASSPVVSTSVESFPQKEDNQQSGAANAQKQLTERLGSVKIDMQLPQSYQTKRLNQGTSVEGVTEEVISIENTDVKLQLKLAAGGMGGGTALSNRSDFPNIVMLRDAAGNNLQRSYDPVDKNDSAFPFVAQYSSDSFLDLCGEIGLDLEPDVVKMCGSEGKLFYPASVPGILLYSQDGTFDDGPDEVVFVTCFAKSKTGFERCDELVKSMRFSL